MVLSSHEIKKNIINSILDFSLNIDNYRQTYDLDQAVVSEMLTLAIEINNLINFLDKDPSKVQNTANFQRPSLELADLRKMKRVLDLTFKYQADINAVAIDIGENLSTANRFLTKGIDYLVNNLSLKDHSKNANQRARSNDAKQGIPPTSFAKAQNQKQSKTSSTKKVVQQKQKKGSVGFFAFVLFLAVLIALGVFVYNVFFNQHATRVTSLVKEYRSDRKLSSISRPSLNVELKVQGTKSILGVFEDVESNFKNQNPNLEYEISGGDSGIAIRDLIDGDISLAASSRIPSVEERRKAVRAGKPLADHRVALDSVVFFVNPSNIIEILDLDEIREIFKADEISWKQATVSSGNAQKINRFSLSKQSGTYSYFKDRVMFGENTSEQIIHIYTPQQMLEMVAADPNAIGFCSLSVFMNDQIANRSRVKIIRIGSIFDDNGTKPTDAKGNLDAELVRRGEYPLTRYLYLVSAGELNASQAKFIDFMRSPEAQLKFASRGLVSIF